MRETVLYIGMSLDGYIADCDGGVGWMGGQDPTDESAGSYPEFLHTVDTVMMGRNTYHQIVTELSPEEWVYAGLRSYVITHRPQPDADGIIFTNESPGALVDRLKVQPAGTSGSAAGPSWSISCCAKTKSTGSISRCCRSCWAAAYACLAATAGKSR